MSVLAKMRDDLALTRNVALTVADMPVGHLELSFVWRRWHRSLSR
jgi:D-alanyl-lipoteichoic acid acyltransferase DltB (MBOAT superfamily)